MGFPDKGGGNWEKLIYKTNYAALFNTTVFCNGNSTNRQEPGTCQVDSCRVDILSVCTIKKHAYLTSVPVVLAAACMRSLNAVLYFALITLNSSRNEKDGITWGDTDKKEI